MFASVRFASGFSVSLPHIILGIVYSVPIQLECTWEFLVDSSDSASTAPNSRTKLITPKPVIKIRAYEEKQVEGSSMHAVCLAHPCFGA